MNANLGRILGIKLLTAAQGLEFRKPLSTSTPLLSVLAAVRAEVPPYRKTVSLLRIWKKPQFSYGMGN